ncbi:hypothetical protein LINPERPRIM_LOCUS6972 [Linum perenne]
MLFFHLNMSAAHLPANPALMGIAVDHGVVECMFSTRLAPPNYHIPYVRSLCAMCGSLSSSRRILTIGVASASSDAQPTFDFDKYFLSELGICSTDEQFTYENKGECEAELSEVRSMFHDAENAEKKQRRRDLKHGNKGRVPWNKGRKHSAETRELIKRRTIEALRSPQVKSCPVVKYLLALDHKQRARKKREDAYLFGARKHSDENKAKISSSLRRLWNKRLKQRRSAEKFFFAWAESIAIAAKNGGLNEEMLHWNSYNEIEQEIFQHQLQSDMEKKMAKELRKMKLANAAQEKAEKLAAHAQKEKDREQNAKSREEERRDDHRSPMKNTEKSSVNRELIPKQKILKIRRKKSTNKKVLDEGRGAQISSSQIWEKIDLELTEREPRKVSLADQIKAARNKRSESEFGAAAAV